MQGVFVCAASNGTYSFVTLCLHVEVYRSLQFAYVLVLRMLACIDLCMLSISKVWKSCRHTWGAANVCTSSAQTFWAYIGTDHVLVSAWSCQVSCWRCLGSFANPVQLCKSCSILLTPANPVQYCWPPPVLSILVRDTEHGWMHVAQMRKTDCFGETRLVHHVPSSSWAGQRIYCCCCYDY